MTEAGQGIARAVRFLHRSRAPDGLWHDFRTALGVGSEWVTAFVAHALAVLDPSDQTVHDALTVLRRRQRASGGWGYSTRTSPDCDTTAWFLLAARAAGHWRPSAAEQAVAYIRRHQGPDGGFCTYTPDDGIARLIGRPDSATSGWMSQHVCVTGVALQALLATPGDRQDPAIGQAAGFLRSAQAASGGWSSYWWTGRAYASLHAVRALRCMGHRGAAGPAGAWMLRTQDASGGWAAGQGAPECFETAQAILLLLHEPQGPFLAAAARGVQWLRSRQQEDGSWMPAPMMRIPRPDAGDPRDDDRWRVGGLGNLALIGDHRRLFTTAACIWALAAARRVMDAAETPQPDA